MALSESLIVVLVLVVLLAGALNGVAGFGFAIVGTMALATMIDPAAAVVFMIFPILAVNLALVRDLTTQELRTCGQRFAPLILAALVGTVVGLVVLLWGTLKIFRGLDTAFSEIYGTTGS